MIDTDKYEGHIENIGRWQMFANALPRWAEDADRKLVQDAPLLLEELKRLRERLEVIEDFINDELRAFVNSNAFDHIYDAMEKKLEMIE
jgi:FMN phosphatase YigB (HAD superfamily)